mmetsp:Transcript_28389/g.81511  ORF Transcript_28389/g.81511 Transcript_28389/m.81511 type:complete len:276 (+) Transcript_28389:655-1482(+)
MAVRQRLQQRRRDKSNRTGASNGRCWKEATSLNDDTLGVSQSGQVSSRSNSGMFAGLVCFPPALALLVIVVAKHALVAIRATTPREEAAAPASAGRMIGRTERGVQSARRRLWRNGGLDNLIELVVVDVVVVIVVVVAFVRIRFLLFLFFVLPLARAPLGERSGGGRLSRQHAGTDKASRLHVGQCCSRPSAIAPPVEEAMVVVAAPRRRRRHRCEGPVHCRRRRPGQRAAARRGGARRVRQRRDRQRARRERRRRHERRRRRRGGAARGHGHHE